MFDLLLFIVSVLIAVWCLAPRMFRYADALCAKQRITSAESQVPDTTTNAPTRTVSSDQFFDALARDIRSQTDPREALMKHIPTLAPQEVWLQAHRQLLNGHSLTSVVEHCARSKNEVAQLLAMAFVHQSFSAEALDQAAHIQRTHLTNHQSLKAATAQARITMRILTVLPLAVLTLGVFFSSSLRSSVTTPAVLVVVLLGVALNRLGAWWVSRLIAKTALRSHNQHVTVLVDSLCVAVKAGHTITEACLLWNTVNETGASVAQYLRLGYSLHEALHEFAISADAFESLVAHTLIAAHADGLPIHTTAVTLATESRKAQQAQLDIRLRQLPTKLSLPLVFCVLPSFGLLVLAPLLLAHLSRFGSVLPSSLT